MILKVISKIR